MTKSRVFVSYTRRDGLLSDSLLESIEVWLSGVCQPYIHRTTKSARRLEQLMVVKALLKSHVLLVIESPGVYDSPWVRFELNLARLKLMPVIKVPARQILDLQASDC